MSKFITTKDEVREQVKEVNNLLCSIGHPQRISVEFANGDCHIQIGRIAQIERGTCERSLFAGFRQNKQALLALVAFMEGLKAMKPILNEVDTAFEVVRISWDNPTPQATGAINDVWRKIRNLI